MNGREIYEEMSAASLEVSQGLLEVKEVHGLMDEGRLMLVLRRLNVELEHFVNFTMMDTGGNPTKERLQAAIDLSGGDLLPYNGPKFEAAMKGEFIPTDPVEIIVINYILDMRARLDKIWEKQVN